LFHFCGLRFGVYYTQITTKKVKLPVSHSPISKETVFRIIHFILAHAETIIKRFSTGVMYLLCCMFLLQYCKATTTVNLCTGL